jgi:hypothetical protein
LDHVFARRQESLFEDNCRAVCNCSATSRLQVVISVAQLDVQEEATSKVVIDAATDASLRDFLGKAELLATPSAHGLVAKFGKWLAISSSDVTVRGKRSGG